MRILPYGDRALLVELDAGADVAALRATLTGVAGIDELVPAARTMLVTFARAATSAEVRTAIEQAATRAAVTAPHTAPGRLVVLPVRYDGPDLAFAAQHTGWTVDDVIRCHVEPEYTVAFCGFAPGFAYLTGLDRALQLPRLDTPRASIRSGSVGVAGEYTAAYPRSSPGGWRLLGHTDAVLWDVTRAEPALLMPGTRVRFEVS